MNASFTVQGLLNGGAVVMGTDIHGAQGMMEVSTHQWESIQRTVQSRSNQEQFDQKVEDFFKPLTDAAQAVLDASKQERDPLSYVTLKPGVEGTIAAAEEVVHLNNHSIILRILEDGIQSDINRLVWLDDETLVILEAPVQVDSTEPPF